MEMLYNVLIFVLIQCFCSFNWWCIWNNSIYSCQLIFSGCGSIQFVSCYTFCSLCLHSFFVCFSSNSEFFWKSQPLLSSHANNTTMNYIHNTKCICLDICYVAMAFISQNKYISHKIITWNPTENVYENDESSSINAKSW